MALPVIGIIIHTGLVQRKEAINVAKMDTQKLADRIAYEQQIRTASVRQLMVALSQIPEIKQKNAGRTTELVRQIVKANTDISNIIIADRSGRVWATAIPVKTRLTISDRRYFRNTVERGEFSSGEYVVSRAVNKPVFNLGYPVKDEQGEVVGVIAVGFLLEKYSQILEKSKLPKNASFSLFDHKGVILFRGVEPEKYIGKQADPGLFRTMQQGPDESTGIGPSFVTGDNRIASSRKLRLEGEEAPYMYVRAGIPVDSVLEESNRDLLLNLMFFSWVLILAFLSSSFIGKCFIVSRIDALEKAALALASGDLGVNVSRIVTGGELGRLALSFDEMAHQLDLRERALFDSQERLRTFIAHAPVILFVLDREGVITFSDGRGLAKFGLSPGEVVGRSAFDLYKDSPSVLDGIRRALAGEACHIEATVGSKIFEVRYNPIRNREGSITSTIGVATDVTRRKLAEERARERGYRYKVLFESANDGIFILGATGFLDCNQRGADMYGLRREQVIGHSPVQFAPERQPDGGLSSEVAADKIQLALTGEPQVFEWQSLRADGSPFDVEITLNRIDLAGSIRLQAIVRDITKRRQAEEALKLNEERFSSLLKLYQTRFVNEKQITDFALEEVVRLTRSTGGYLHFFNEEEQTLQLDTWSQEVLKTCTVVHDQHYPLQSAGVWADSARTRGAVVHNDYQGLSEKKGYPEGHFHLDRHLGISIMDGDRIVGVVGVGNKELPYNESDVLQITLIMNGMWSIVHEKRMDIEREAFERKLLHAATYDCLTGVLNRQALENSILTEMERAKRYGSFLSVIMLDIDDFKSVNDTLGHLAGDETLVSTAGLLGKNIRLVDSVGRWGGEEFVVVLPDTKGHEAVLVAEKLRKALLGHKVNEVSVTASFGVSMYDRDDTLDTLMKKADDLLYRAKSRGKNRVEA